MINASILFLIPSQLPGASHSPHLKRLSRLAPQFPLFTRIKTQCDQRVKPIEFSTSSKLTNRRRHQCILLTRDEPISFIFYQPERAAYLHAIFALGRIASAKELVEGLVVRTTQCRAMKRKRYLCLFCDGAGYTELGMACLSKTGCIYT